MRARISRPPQIAVSDAKSTVSDRSDEASGAKGEERNEIGAANSGRSSSIPNVLRNGSKQQEQTNITNDLVTIDASQEPSVSGNTNPSSTIDKSFVGRPALVSLSIRKRLDACKERAKSDRYDPCVRLYNKLAHLSQEPRDTTWADHAESNIRQAIVQAISMQYQIRHLECRQSTCAVEVSSDFGPFVSFSYEQVLTLGLQNTAAEFADEINEYGAKTTVTLQIFDRR